MQALLMLLAKRLFAGSSVGESEKLTFKTIHINII